MNIIEHKGAEAVTTDGIRWDIYVRDTELVKDIANGKRLQTSEIRYGSWSQKDGLKRGAIYPSEDFRVLEQRGARVYEYLLRHHNDVPFPLRDETELWLLDTQGDPLGLLDSVIEKEAIELDCFIDWRAGQACNRTFATPAIEGLTDTLCADHSAGEYLTQFINGRAGEHPAAQWFERKPDGSGIGMQGINLAARLENRTLPHTAFPRYFLKEDGCSRVHRQLIQDFLAWLAPCQLLLQDLDRSERQHFEQLARSRALEVNKHFHLYPLILDDGAIRAARVEAELRRDELQDANEDETMATYYIELNVTRTN
jgi:hypothetical protein